MKAVIVAAGECPSAGMAQRRVLLRSADLVVAADGGLVHCVKHDVWPDLLVGDADSAPAELAAQAAAHGTTTISHPVDKNHTDLELAVDQAISRGATQITVIAVLGGRLDHELASIAMLASPDRAHATIVIDDGVQRVHVVHSALDLALPRGTSLSLLPIGGPAVGVNAVGFKWPLVHATLVSGSTLGVSNQAVDGVQRISVEQGTLLVVLSGDR